MQGQMSFSFPTPAMERDVWVTGNVVDRDGAAAYVVLIRHPDDPARAPRPPGGQKDRAPHLTLRRSTVEEWRHRLLAHLADGSPRTFNRMMVELIDKTADICFREVPEQALWALVEEGLLEHTLMAPILFRLRGSSR